MCMFKVDVFLVKVHNKSNAERAFIIYNKIMFLIFGKTGRDEFISIHGTTSM